MSYLSVGMVVFQEFLNCSDACMFIFKDTDGMEDEFAEEEWSGHAHAKSGLISQVG